MGWLSGLQRLILPFYYMLSSPATSKECVGGSGLLLPVTILSEHPHPRNKRHCSHFIDQAPIITILVLVLYTVQLYSYVFQSTARQPILFFILLQHEPINHPADNPSGEEYLERQVETLSECSGM